MTDEQVCARCGRTINPMIPGSGSYTLDDKIYCSEKCLPDVPHIRMYIPMFCTGFSSTVWVWQGVDAFKKAYPNHEGMEWMYSVHQGRGYCYAQFMEASIPNDDGVREHWVLQFMTDSPQVIEDLLKSDIPHWSDEYASIESTWNRAKNAFADCSSTPWFKKWAKDWLAEHDD